MEKKQTKLKAHRMWANYKTTASKPRVFCSADDCLGDTEWTDHLVVAVPVAVIPLDDVPSLVNNAMQSFHFEKSGMFEPAMYAALVAIGVLPKRKGRK